MIAESIGDFKLTGYELFSVKNIHAFDENIEHVLSIWLYFSQQKYDHRVKRMCPDPTGAPATFRDLITLFKLLNVLS